MQGRLQPVFLISPRYRNEIAAAIESTGRPVVAARGARDAERRFAQSAASVVVVDARGAIDLGLSIARSLSGTVEATGAAMLVLLSRPDAKLLGDVYDAGGTHFLISPFGVAELGSALRFAERYSRRLALGDKAVTRGRRAEDLLAWRFDIGSRGAWLSAGLARPAGIADDESGISLPTVWRALGSEGRLALKDAVRRLLASGRATAFAHRTVWNGRTHRLAHHLRLERDEDGRVTGIAATVEDLEAAAVDRRASSHFDQLTRLANAASFNDWVSARLAGQSAYDPAVIVIMIAISRFDEINAAYGRSVGDALLEAVGRRLSRRIDDDDGETALVARLGGAEFAVALGGPITLSEASFLAQRIGESFDRPYLSAGHMVHLTCRMGVAVGEASLESADTLLRRASAALADAKEQEPNTFHIYVGDSRVDALRELATLESDLRQAMTNDEIVILFQPQVDIATGAVTGVEALTRWLHPRLGTLSAETLLSVAERAEIFPLLSGRIWERTLEVARAWPKTLDHVRLSVNIGATELGADDFARKFLERIDAGGFDRNRITLEITESGLIENLERAATMLADFRSRGLRIAIDDFGTGYSSLAYLKALPLDYLKLDRRLAGDMAGSARDRIVVSGVIEMARSLGLGVVAEGVETEEQLVVLARAGCTSYQGYLCSRPLAADELAAFIMGWEAQKVVA